MNLAPGKWRDKNEIAVLPEKMEYAKKPGKMTDEELIKAMKKLEKVID